MKLWQLLLLLNLVHDHHFYMKIFTILFTAQYSSWRHFSYHNKNKARKCF